jgi:hypothetical protein
VSTARGSLNVVDASRLVPDHDPAGAWEMAMRRGDFAAAWEISDAVLAARVANGPCWHWSRHTQWVWDGRPLADQRVLVRCYHGLGDTLQFARFLPALAEMCRELTVWAQPILIPLLQRMRAPLKLLPLHDGTPDIDYDVDIEIMEVAHALRATTDSLPRDVPYFRVAAERPLCSGTKNVGMVALAGEWDPRRSVPTELMATLAEVPGVRTYSLQLGAAVPRATDLSTPDMLTLAERLSGLDLVVTVDTMTAHLAGALAVPTWTLLMADADWRWMDGRADSPWYPTMRLFRQSAPGDWASVIARVRAALAG